MLPLAVGDLSGVFDGAFTGTLTEIYTAAGDAVPVGAGIVGLFVIWKVIKRFVRG